MYHVYADAFGGQRAWDPLKLELQVAVSQLVDMVGFKPTVSAREVSTRDSLAISPGLQLVHS